MRPAFQGLDVFNAQLLIGEIDLVLSELARDPLGAQEAVVTMPEPQPDMAPPALFAPEMAVGQ